jgi:hypothetical protein
MLSVVLAALLASTDSVTDCRRQAPSSSTPYTAAVARTLASFYDLTLVELKPRPVKPITGRLELVPADSLHRWTVAPLGGSGPRAQGLDRPLWGAVEFSGRPFPDSQPLARRDPDHPAVWLIADGRLILRWPPPATFHLELKVERAGPDGFGGRWNEGRGLQVMASTGPNLGPSSSYFCAMRRPASGSPGA